MELTIILLLVSQGVAILMLGAINIVKIVTDSNDRRELEKMIKASNLQEYKMYSDQEEEETEEVEDGFVPIEEIGNYLGVDKKRGQ